MGTPDNLVFTSISHFPPGKPSFFSPLFLTLQRFGALPHPFPFPPKSPDLMKSLLSLLLFLAAFVPVGLSAQKAVDAAEAAQMMAQINDAARTTTSLQATFVQTKSLRVLNSRLVARGTMHYRQPAQLRWTYTTPYRYTFVLNGRKVMLKSDKQTQVVDVEQNKVFRRIAQIMMDSMTGRCLNDRRSFKVGMFSEGNHWVARLTPLQSEMKQLFSSLSLTFDALRHIVVRVEMKEKTGDTTLIELQQIKKDAPIDAQLFKVD